jgi:predicted nucleic-acid-binding Zn-ribbon protein
MTRISDASFDTMLTLVNAKINRLSPCPGCGTNDWALDQTIYDVKSYNPPGTQQFYGNQGQPGPMPMVAILCKKCGHVRFFSAITLGIVRQDGTLAINP